ncbi:DUF3592 domain-containing protein [Verrucomicrobiaceae bacterium N1E253]|uniref:DUF3592 domain-containing protein n=1 Tax=Oceaniferula marina TaxID=2748318 RepID=A0A851GEY1_9BACT|nr:DUF3592 domain-containing protein [Oceaniferula marina]NWK55452.1 DUF3592 domain-containing protein [Oceaniferula marina]
MTLIDRLLRASSPGRSIAWSGRLLALAIGLLFGGAGLAILWSTGLGPILKVQAAQSWIAAEGTIIDSGVDSDDEGGKNLTIRYRYQVNGKTYESDQYNPTETSRNFATESLEQAKEAHPVGTAVTVWVNPDDHQEAIIDRSVQPIAWMSFFFPLPFLTAGICGIGWAVLGGYLGKRSLQLREHAARRADKAGCHHLANRLRDPSDDDNESILFLDGDDRLAGAGSLALCCFVNGIVGTFVLVMILMFLSGEGMAIFLFFFLLPFEWIGIGILINTLRLLTGPRAPDYLIIAKPAQPQAGPMTINIQWLFLGRSNKVSRYRELELTVTRGDVHHAYAWFKKKKQTRQVQAAKETISIANSPKSLSGEHSFHIPADSKNNKWGNYQGTTSLMIRWKARGEKQRLQEFILGQTEND